jgi:hypothetical protein
MASISKAKYHQYQREISINNQYQWNNRIISIEMAAVKIMAIMAWHQ